jgi:hypothetical protein
MFAGYTLMMMSYFQASSSEAESCVDLRRGVQTRCERGVKTAIEVVERYSTGSDFLEGLKSKSSIISGIRMPRSYP